MGRYSTLKSQFPNFRLEDKAVLSGGSIVRDVANSNAEEDSLAHHGPVGPREWLVYSRRGKRVTKG
jgi:hypothetical protein